MNLKQVFVFLAPTDCKWGDWDYGKCSKTCGGGKRTNYRKVLVHQSNGGKACTGSTWEFQNCNTQSCPVKKWKPLQPQTKLGGPWVGYSTDSYGNGDPIPATIAYPVAGEDDVWIIGAKDGHLKMVKIRITGPNTYDWIESYYSSEYGCLDNFTESCFAGTSTKCSGKCYVVKLVAEKQ